MKWATIIEACFPLCGGIWCLLFGCGYVRSSPLDAPDTYRRRLKWRVIGCLLIGFAFLQVVDAALQAQRPPEWTTYQSGERNFRLEMPGRPETSSFDESTEYGKATNYQAKVRLKNADAVFSITDFVFPEGFPQTDADGTDQLIQGLIRASASEVQGKVVEEQSIPVPNGRGREYRIEAKQNRIIQGRLIQVDRRQFMLLVVSPPNVVAPELVRRFFDSFAYHPPANKGASS